MRLLTRSPKEKVPKSHLKWECDSKSNIIARFTPTPQHRSAHRYEFKLKLHILYIHFYPGILVGNSIPTALHDVCVRLTIWFWYLSATSSSVFVGTHGEICDIYISDSVTQCHMSRCIRRWKRKHEIFND